MKTLDNIKEIIDSLPEDVARIFKHGTAVGCGIIVFGTVADLVPHYVHDDLTLQIIERADQLVLLAFVIGLGIEFVGTLYKRIWNSLFHSWVLFA